MGNSGKEGGITKIDFLGPCFDLDLYILFVRSLYHHIYRIVIYHRDIDIKTLFEHLPNKIMLNSFPEGCGVPE